MRIQITDQLHALNDDGLDLVVEFLDMLISHYPELQHSPPSDAHDVHTSDDRDDATTTDSFPETP